MSLPAYPKYKDSGVEWLGEVPEHWGAHPLKRHIAFLTSGSRGWAEHYSDDGALFIRIGNLTRDSIRLDLADIQRVAVPDGAEGERTTVRPGDILFSITAYLGSVAVAPEGLEPAFVSQHVALARLSEGRLLPVWAAYVALSWVGKTHFETQGYGGTKVQLSLDDVANLLLTVPPLHEQSAIAAFLDRETGKIDALVAEQEKLLALLAEKRQATISRAVTKGLNPAAPMKDSGVEWLGVIPRHWAATRLSHLTRKIVDGAHFTPTYVDEGVPFLRVTDITAPSIDLVDVKRIPISEHKELSRRCKPEKGDLLLSKNGTIGVPKVVTWDWDFSIFVSLCLIKTKNELLSQFLSFVFKSSAIKTQIEEGQKHSTVINLHLEVISGFKVPLPPIEEQIDIVSFLDNETEKLDALTAEATRAIDLLKERRTALISAAVTGKIDVRQAVVAEAV